MTAAQLLVTLVLAAWLGGLIGIVGYYLCCCLSDRIGPKSPRARELRRRYTAHLDAP